MSTLRGLPAVYRCYDMAGVLLYVGSSKDWAKRLKEHANTLWADDVAEVRVRFYSSMELARDAERMAIRTEHPQANKQRGNRTAEWTRSNYETYVAAVSGEPYHPMLHAAILCDAMAAGVDVPRWVLNSAVSALRLQEMPVPYALQAAYDGVPA